MCFCDQKMPVNKSESMKVQKFLETANCTCEDICHNMSETDVLLPEQSTSQTFSSIANFYLEMLHLHTVPAFS